MDVVEGIELKPCPFCGSDDVRLVEGRSDFVGQRQWIECDYCSARGPLEYFPEKVAEEWNDCSARGSWMHRK